MSDRATRDALRRHREWLGYLQPEGLVVAPATLVDAQTVLDDHAGVVAQATLRALAGDADAEHEPCLDDFPRACVELLGWQPGDLAGAPGGPELPRGLEVALVEYGDVLAPTYAVPDPERPGAWLMLVQVVPRTLALDALPADPALHQRWHATPHARCERLLRETRVPIGLLCNGTHLRLLHAPRAESTGHVTFPIAFLLTVEGRRALAALLMLLGAEALFTGPAQRRLPALLDHSRKYQNTVSTRLAEQVLEALHELVRGFQQADRASGGELLREALRHDPQHIYGGLLGTLLRLVFVLYAEDRKLLPQEQVFARHYALAGLFERLQGDHARHPDTLDQRYGAWAHLLTLFRLIHDGGAHGSLRLPARAGRLFDPDTWDFLEGRPWGDVLDRRQRVPVPRVSDGVVYRVLDKLLLLDGDRISYSALDVEQIGSVYEAMMGFELRQAAGQSVTLRPDHVVVDLEALLALAPKARLAHLKNVAACDVAGRAAEALESATTVEQALAALERRLSPLNRERIPRGGLYLQPTQERRRSGSHYTPRALTEPIVRTTLEPLLRALGAHPRPEQILDLKVCDPAMGSGAFLVEACRHLGERLVTAWQVHDATPELPEGEDAAIHARRLIAERCLYGVDRNLFAVDLAKLSLWLATLARHQPFTFLDHALRHGDSLVGLSREQVMCFDWKPGTQLPLVRESVRSRIDEAERLRGALHALGDAGPTAAKAELHAEAMAALEVARLCADATVVAFFERDKDKARETLRQVYAEEFVRVLQGDQADDNLRRSIDMLKRGPQGVLPFHWPIEFPEVFSRARPGFDAVVGNPPFAGKNTLAAGTHSSYPRWLQTLHAHSHGNADLVAHFFRRAFDLLREGGTFGLIATNTIAQGDTRATGLRFICQHGGAIYAATRRVQWPGLAAVIVSVLHVVRGQAPQPCVLDEREVERITAFLFHDGGHDDPAVLRANAGKSFIGSYVLGMGFTFDDNNPDATPLAEMRRLIAKDPRNAERIFPYIGGEEVNESPTHAHRRYVINFGELAEEEARRWPDLMAIVEAKVKPERSQLGDNADAARRKRFWWLWGRYTSGLFTALRGLDRVLVCSLVGRHLSFAWLSSDTVSSHKLGVIAATGDAWLSILQSRVHGLFAWFFSSTMKDDLNYSISDCFETFPFPPGWETNARLEEVGRAYHEFRAALMVRHDEGLTKTYNRFHDPDERNPDILRLRALHDELDRAVLDAYGWTDLHPTCEFLLDYEDEDDADDGTPDATPGHQTGTRRPRRRKPWRWRWPDTTRDEVLARLLALNQQRAAEEAAAAPPTTRKRPPSPKRKPAPGPATLFD
jgi:hypothetical protein